MRLSARLVAAALTTAGLCAGCGQGTAARAPAAAHPARMAAVHIPAARMPAIAGGSAAERTLLRRIVRAMRPTQITRLTIAPAAPLWHPVRPGDVALTAMTAPVAPHHDNTLGEWESMVIGGAFRDRSRALGLPRVIVVGNPSEASRVTGGPDRPAQPAAGLARYRARVRAAAATSGARLIAVRAGVPDGYSALVALQVSDPPVFLQHGLRRLEDRLQRITSDGTFIALYLPDGRPLYSEGGSARLNGGVGGPGDPRYAPCIQNRMLRLSAASPPPCPES